MKLTKWVKVDQIIENYKKKYPKRWSAFVNGMNELRKQDMDNKAKFRLSAKFPTYPDNTDISEAIMKVIPTFIQSDYVWKKFLKKYPEFKR
jgi:hypothetical protein